MSHVTARVTSLSHLESPRDAPLNNGSPVRGAHLLVAWISRCCSTLVCLVVALVVVLVCSSLVLVCLPSVVRLPSILLRFPSVGLALFTFALFALFAFAVDFSSGSVAWVVGCGTVSRGTNCRCSCIARNTDSGSSCIARDTGSGSSYVGSALITRCCTFSGGITLS